MRGHDGSKGVSSLSAIDSQVHSILAGDARLLLKIKNKCIIERWQHRFRARA